MDPTKARVEYLRKWLERHRNATQVAPSVQEALDEAQWELSVLRDRPPEAINLSTSQLDEHSGIALRRITDTLPMLPEYDVSVGLRVNSISTSSSSATFAYVHDVALVGTPAAVEYSLAKADQYRVMQDSHQRRQRVRVLVQELVPRAESRLDAALTAADQSRLGITAKSAAASELRNLVDGIQGELIQKARRTPKEHIEWQTIAERLLPASPEMGALILEQAHLRGSLYNDLSKATKLREGDQSQPIEDLLARVLDHVFAVLSAIKSGQPA